MSDNNELKINVMPLEDLLSDIKLNIPSYQRPYSWTDKQLEPLLHDLYNERYDGQPTIMGGIILHSVDATSNEPEYLNIVDGQQRLITFSLIQYIIDSYADKNENSTPNILLGKLKRHSVTDDNLEKNAAFIKAFIKKKKFTKPNLTNIYFVAVETKLIEDAFSFFDSQNTRGKKLEDYDILKAHHLRYIESDILATFCAKDWEKIEKDTRLGLKYLLETILMRSRKWSRGQHYSHILQEEFKSQRTRKKSHNEYELSRYSQAALFSKWKYNPSNNIALEFYFHPIEAIYKVGSIQVSGSENYKYLPFQLGQTIEGGELFFWYTNKYHALYKELFDVNNPQVSSVFKQFVAKLKSFNYNTGAEYVYQVYKGALLFYYDKFGYYKYEEAAETLFFNIYWLRMKQSTVQYASIYKYIRDFNPFSLIQEASFPDYLISKCADSLEEKYLSNDYNPSSFKGIRKELFAKLLTEGQSEFIKNSSITKTNYQYV